MHPVETYHRLSRADLLAAAAAARRAFRARARVRHAARGPGVVVELMADGRTRIAFDSGEVRSLRTSPPSRRAAPPPS